MDYNMMSNNMYPQQTGFPISCNMECMKGIPCPMIPGYMNSNYVIQPAQLNQLNKDMSFQTQGGLNLDDQIPVMPDMLSPIMMDIEDEDDSDEDDMTREEGADIKIPCSPCYPYQYPEYSRVPEKPTSNFSFIRILHASPDAPAVDIYANGNPIARNLAYKGFTPYVKVPSGSYNIKVFPAGKKVNPVIDANLEIPGKSIFTIAAINKLANISLLPILEPLHTANPGFAMVRFVHLSPSAPPVDITLPNGQKLFKDVEFKEVTGYIPLRPGNYSLQARQTGTNKVVLVIPNIVFKPKKLFTIYAIGLTEGTPPLQVLIPQDGGSYLKFR